MPDTWLTADLHLKHKNILRFQSNRIFDSVEEHDETIIENWNKVVKPQDTLWFLGDFAFCSQTQSLKYLNRLNGHIKFIIGNHDTKTIKNINFRNKLDFLNNYFELKGLHKLPIVLSHYPMCSWNRSFHGSLHFHGHAHGNIANHYITRFDVGVDTHPDFRPWNINELIIPTYTM